MYGIDISNYQASIDLYSAKYDFAIIKATEGVGYTDKSFNNFSVQLTKLGKLIGAYHFARPDLHSTISEMEEEAKWFSQVIQESGLLRKSILVLDWEIQPYDRTDLIKAWINKVRDVTDVTPFIYTSKAILEKISKDDTVRNCPIWVAQWPSNSTPEVGADPGFKQPITDPQWTIWQYTSKGKYPGYCGNVDLNYTSLDKETWKEMAGEVKEEVITDDMQWAINNGLFAGYGNGKYGVDDPLTRGQCATVLRAFKEKFIG